MVDADHAEAHPCHCTTPSTSWACQPTDRRGAAYGDTAGARTNRHREPGSPTSDPTPLACLLAAAVVRRRGPRPRSHRAAMSRLDAGRRSRRRRSTPRRSACSLTRVDGAASPRRSSSPARATAAAGSSSSNRAAGSGSSTAARCSRRRSSTSGRASEPAANAASSASRSTRSTGRNGRFFVDYTDTQRQHGHRRVPRAPPTNSNSCLDDASACCCAIAQPFANHNGGMLAFGPDGYLYIGMGDGGSAGDPGNRAQSTATRLGKLLRIDVDHRSGRLQYANPPSNPYVGRSGLDEIWAIGLRNPWRFSFDRLTGDLWIGDVGQGQWEEIDRATKAGGLGRARTTAGGSWRVGPATTRRPAARRPARRCRSPSTRTTSAARSPAGTSTAARRTRRWPAATCSATTARAGSGP